MSQGFTKLTHQKDCALYFKIVNPAAHKQHLATLAKQGAKGLLLPNPYEKEEASIIKTPEVLIDGEPPLDFDPFYEDLDDDIPF